jgi:hypothetical protein
MDFMDPLSLRVLHVCCMSPYALNLSRLRIFRSLSLVPPTLPPRCGIRGVRKKTMGESPL